MKPSDDLFRLIGSLSRNEKRYFSIYASRHVVGDRNEYMRLFRAIDGMSVYDETLLRKKLRGTGTVRRLPEAKVYLYRLILKSLRAYHVRHSPEIEARELLDEATILFKRGLRGQARKLAFRALKMARKQEHRALIVDVVGWLVDTGLLEYSSADTMLPVVDEGLASVAELAETFRCARDYLRVPQSLDQATHHQLFVTSFSQPEVRSEATVEPSITLQAGWYNYLARFHIMSRNVNPDQAFRFSHEFMLTAHDAFQAVPSLRNGRIYSAVLADLTYIALIAERYIAAGEVVRLYRVFARHQIGIEVLGGEFYALRSAGFLEAVYAAACGEFSNAMLIIEKVEDLGNRSIDNTDWLSWCNGLASYALLGQEKYRAATDRINQSLSSPVSARLNQRPLLLNALAIMHIDMGNTDIVLSNLRALERYARTRGGLAEVQDLAIRSLRKIARASDKERQLELCRELYSELLERSVTRLWGPNELFNLAAWLEARINGKTYQEVIRQRVLECMKREKKERT